MSTTDIEAARCALRTAHSDRSQAIENLEAAREAADRGKQLLDSAEAELADKTAAAVAADEAAAARLAERIRSGEATASVVDLRTSEPAEALARAQRRHNTARAAHQALSDNVTVAEQALRAAEAEISRAAIGVVGAEADALLAELGPTITAARELETYFASLARFLPVLPHDDGASVARAVRAAREIYTRRDPVLTSVIGFDPETVTTRRLVSYLAALKQDADAEFDSIGDPQARRPAQAAAE